MLHIETLSHMIFKLLALWVEYVFWGHFCFFVLMEDPTFVSIKV